MSEIESSDGRLYRKPLPKLCFDLNRLSSKNLAATQAGRKLCVIGYSNNDMAITFLLLSIKESARLVALYPL